jgi:uncharacterized RDD family membrane protein YckC
MTMTADDYIARVLEVLPRTLPLRSQIALELSVHIAERVQHGHSMDDVLQQLGDPVVLAESYLAAEPLVAARFGARVLAKLVDLLTVLVALMPVALAGYWLVPRDFVIPFLVFVLLLPGSFTFGIYTALAEYKVGQTLGKHFMNLRVVRESGARISLGQAIVRQLPMFFQFYWVDIMFAVFTDRKQRAFELLSKTRVVRVSPNPTNPI